MRKVRVHVIYRPVSNLMIHQILEPEVVVDVTDVYRKREEIRFDVHSTRFGQAFRFLAKQTPNKI